MLSKEFSNELKLRRQKVFDEMPNASIALLPSAKLQWRNNDAEYPFRQCSDFYYLTGFCEPDSVLFLIKDKQGKTEYGLFCQPKNEEEEIWTGPKAGIEGAKEVFAVDKAFPVEKLEEQLLEWLSDYSHLLYSFGSDRQFDKKIEEWLGRLQRKNRRGFHSPKMIIDFKSMIHRFRRVKSDYEITLMKKAAEISALGHLQLMKLCRPNLMEYQLEGDFLQHCFYKGIRMQAYTPIVAGGKNACILHYTDNDKPLREGDLVLIDAGGEYQYYASDITRTFPISLKFNQPQKQIYDLTLKAQMAAIDQIRPGVPFARLQEVIVDILVEGFIALGLLTGDKKTLIEQKAYQRFYMHSSGHWLGLDVHDVGDYKDENGSVLFEPGMVLTVEPGIYIAPNQKDVDKKWWGIGVRIEDDVLVTKTGHEVLSSAVPKTVEEIEKIRASQ